VTANPGKPASANGRNVREPEKTLLARNGQWTKLAIVDQLDKRVGDDHKIDALTQ